MSQQAWLVLNLRHGTGLTWQLEWRQGRLEAGMASSQAHVPSQCLLIHLPSALLLSKRRRLHSFALNLQLSSMSRQPLYMLKLGWQLHMCAGSSGSWGWELGEEFSLSHPLTTRGFSMTSLRHPLLLTAACHLPQSEAKASGKMGSELHACFLLTFSLIK